jgi:hypothetical protein
MEFDAQQAAARWSHQTFPRSLFDKDRDTASRNIWENHVA